MAKYQFPTRLLALVYLLIPCLVTAAPPRFRPSFINPIMTPATNLSLEPRIHCDGPESRYINLPERRECKAAVAHLPYAYPDIRHFSPYEPTRSFRTPIISTHETNCEARVQLVEGLSSVRSSWQEIKEAAWDLVATCLDGRKRVGRARTGAGYGIEISIKYHYPLE
ncbi:MAG: hypothetical protein Q9196_004328 [Gyalolechia fulgens]